MRRTTRAAGLLLALVVATAAGVQAQPISLGQIIRDPARFEHRPVLVHGIVGIVEPAGGRQAFQLIDGGVQVRVLGPGQPAVRPGDRVEVEGTWSAVASQIDAFRVSRR